MKINETRTTYISAPSEIFSEMLQIGIPDNFKSDLWHDGITLANLWDKHIQEPKKSWWFYWTLRESGTHLGECLNEFVDMPCKHFHIKSAYKFEFTEGHENQRGFLLKITRLNKVGQEADAETRKAYGV